VTGTTIPLAAAAAGAAEGAAGSEDDAGPRRSLVLAGGGMRVAYQAGVIRALDEAGLRFHHGDGTSGGIMNLAMILSGQDPVEMGERWRTLDQRQFMSLLPLRQYLRSPRWPAMGSATGVRQRVFPHLGIDVARIRAAEAMVGTFNVCNFSRKVAEVIEHRDIDLDMLVAGVSLPVLMPAVPHGTATYFDAVWIRDSNVAEAVRRGADEVWLVWCIGNTPDYFNGSFRQYVHMIEVAANASLFADFDYVRDTDPGRTRPIVLHVVKPETPIPLDPDYFLGRIDAGTLIEMGYRDACTYLDHLDPAGVPWTPEATQMRRAAPAVLMRPTLTGHLATAGTGTKDPLVVALAPEIADAAALGYRSEIAAPTTGHITTPAVGTRIPFRRARTTLSADGRLSFEATINGRSGPLHLSGEATVGHQCMAVSVRQERSADTTDAVVGDGELILDREAGWSALRTTHVTHAATSGDRWRALRALVPVAVRHALKRWRKGPRRNNLGGR
jgi:predicted acylesterase/phospholipase RssA